MAGNEDWETTWLHRKGIHGEVVALQEVTCKPGQLRFSGIQAIGVRAFDFDRHAAKLQEQQEVKAALKATQSLRKTGFETESFKHRSRRSSGFKMVPGEKILKAK